MASIADNFGLYNFSFHLQSSASSSLIKILGPQISSLFRFKLVPIATRLILEKCLLLKPITVKE